MLAVSRPSSGAGILYILELELEDLTLVKIGITSRTKVEDRICEILTAVWKKYRVFPRCYVKRYKKVDGYTSLERKLHKHFKSRQFKAKYKFGGSTELFAIPLDEAVAAYETLVKGGTLDELPC